MATRKPTTKRRGKGEDETVLFGFPATLPYTEDEDDAAEEKRAMEAEAAAPAVSEAVQKEMAELRAQISALQRTNSALLATPVAPLAPPPSSPDFTNLPDPAIQPEDYAKELARRQTEHQQRQAAYQQEVSRRQGQQQSLIDELWEDFKDEHPEYAEDAEGVQYAAGKAVAKAQRRGLDVQRYVLSPAFTQDVIKTYDKRFGRPGEAEDTGGGDEEELDNSRTQGIVGRGGQAGGRQKDPDDQPSDLMTDIRDFQMRTGFHR